jgi:hypothetical protein
VANWNKNTYVGCTITEYPKIIVRACLPQHKNKPHSELRPASIKKKTHIAEKSDQTKMGMVMLCTTGPASVPSKT